MGEVYNGRFIIPATRGLTKHMLEYLSDRGYIASVDRTGEFDYQLTVDKPLDEFDFKLLASSPHSTSFSKVE